MTASQSSLNESKARSMRLKPNEMFCTQVELLCCTRLKRCGLITTSLISHRDELFRKVHSTSAYNAAIKNNKVSNLWRWGWGLARSNELDAREIWIEPVQNVDPITVNMLSRNPICKLQTPYQQTFVWSTQEASKQLTELHTGKRWSPRVQR